MSHHLNAFDMSLVIQNVLVGIVIAAAVVYMLVRLFRLFSGDRTHCHCSDCCKNKEKREKHDVKFGGIK